MVMHRKVIVRPEMAIEYSGPESIIERLNSSRPINADLILEVYESEKLISLIVILYIFMVYKLNLTYGTYFLLRSCP